MYIRDFVTTNPVSQKLGKTVDKEQHGCKAFYLGNKNNIMLLTMSLPDSAYNFKSVRNPI